METSNYFDMKRKRIMNAFIQTQSNAYKANYLHNRALQCKANEVKSCSYESSSREQDFYREQVKVKT